MSNYIASGAAPFPKERIRPKGLPPLRKMVPGTFSGGPQIVVGPFIFADNGKTQKRRYSKRWYEDAVGSSIRNWVRSRLGDILPKWRSLCLMPGPVPTLPNMYVCTSEYKGWGARGKRDKLPLQVWNGNTPVAKTQHEKTGKWWGIYVEFRTGEVIVTFKEVPRTFFEKIWDLIVTVVSFIVDTIRDLYSIFKGIACAYAKKELDKISEIARGEKALDKATASMLSGFGVTAKDMKEIRESGEKGTTIDEKTATTIGNAVVSSICNTDPPFPQETGPSWLLWAGAGGVGLIALVILFKKKK